MGRPTAAPWPPTSPSIRAASRRWSGWPKAPSSPPRPRPTPRSTPARSAEARDCGKDEAMTKFGLQLPNFTFSGVPDNEMFEHVAELAVAGEESGFDSVWVMDHFWQLPPLGGPSQPMLEGYTLLGGLAARTERVQLGTLVTGVTYRNPALLAKMVTTLDVISHGRAILGIGAAWYEPEHDGFGFPFPSDRERLHMLEEAVQICRALLRDERPTFEGRFYSTVDARNVPKPLQTSGPPIMIGGS